MSSAGVVERGNVLLAVVIRLNKRYRHNKKGMQKYVWHYIGIHFNLPREPQVMTVMTIARGDVISI